MIARHPRSLYERDAELAALDAVFRAATSGGRLVLVHGPPGIGRTRLLAAARERASAAGLGVVRARGIELEQDRPYGVVRQLFESALATMPARLEEPDVSFAALHRLYRAIASMAARGPLAVCIDDVHWCDPASLRWIAHLLPRLEDIPVVVVASTPSLHVTGDDGLLARLASDPLAVLLRLAPLSEAGSAEVVRDLSPGADPALCAACHAESGGNPLWLRELVRAVSAAGLAPGGAAAVRLRALGAQAIRRAVAIRLRRGPRAALAIARAVAVLGDAAEIERAAALAGVDGDDAAESVLALRDRDVLRTEPSLGFVHPVVRAAVEADIWPPERSRLHRRAAALLSEAAADPERVAGHLLIAPAGRDPGVVETLRVAARAALRRGAPETAVAYLERALREPPGGDARAGVLTELGRSESLVAGPAAAEHLADALTAVSEPRERAELGVVLGTTLSLLARVPEAVGAYERAFAELPPGDTPLHRLLEVARAHAAFTLGGTIDLPPGRGSADDLGGRWREALAAYGVAHSVASAADAADRAERALAGGVLAEHDHGGAALALASLVLVHADRDVRPVLDDALARARVKGSVIGIAGAEALRARAALLRGDLHDAERHAADALDAAERWSMGAGAPLAAACLTDALMEQGRLDAAARALARATAGPDAVVPVPERDLGHRHWVAGSAARLRLLTGDRRGGVRELLAAGRRMEALGLDNPAVTAWRSEAAVALLQLGERDRATALAAEELALSRRWGAPRPIAASLRALGLAEGGSSGLRRLEEAVAVAAESPARLEEARARVELGAALRRANRRNDAREPLRAGLDLAVRLGAAPLAKRAETELSATGARARRLLLRGLDALTASERRVAALAAQGASNREIAQSLFVTTKTVEVHLTSAYRKLEISSRVQLPAALAA